MSLQVAEHWRQLLQELRPDSPPSEGDMNKLYVRPAHGCAEEVVRNFLANPMAYPKFLLIGARGGGKSTELREIGRLLSGKATLIGLDLDASGLSASSMSAYDLLYLSALALLSYLPVDEGEGLYEELSKRYSGKSTKKDAERELGSLSTALGGIATFATSATAAAVVAGLTAGAAPVIAGAAVAASTGARLLSSKGEVVAESSPRGRSLQEICEKIAQAVRRGNQSRQICVLIDGLEKMNGEAGERFNQVFSQTRLLADPRWASVIAAPPCTITETNSVDGRGFTTKPVWGFGPDDLGALEELLKRRFLDARFDPSRDVDPGCLTRIAEASGGLPRHAIQIAQEAVFRASGANSPRLTAQHTNDGIRVRAEQLGRGLTAEHLEILRKVASSGLLPKRDEAATLFADGRILAYPPRVGKPVQRYVVHPLLRNEVDSFSEQALSEP